MAQIFKYMIENKKIIDISKSIDDVQIPEYYFEDESTIYNIETFVRAFLTNVHKDFLIKIMHMKNNRMVKTNDDDIFDENGVYYIFIHVSNSNNIPEKIKSGLSKDENKICSMKHTCGRLYDEKIFEDDNIENKEEFEEENSEEDIFDLFDSMILDSVNTLNLFNELNSVDLKGYIGESKDGLPNGYGTRKETKVCDFGFAEMKKFTIYEGNWKDGYFNGNGILIYYSDETFTNVLEYYKGSFNMCVKHGYGVNLNYKRGAISGIFSGGKCFGNVKFKYFDGSIYEGEWYNDGRHGIGTMTYSNGEIFTGEWLNNKIKYIEDVNTSLSKRNEELLKYLTDSLNSSTLTEEDFEEIKREIECNKIKIKENNDKYMNY